MKVLTSASAPSAGISWPFQRKVTPAALPMRATISWLARMEAWAGAMRVSWLTVWPSARTEIQEVSVARITSVRVGADFCGRFGIRLGEGSNGYIVLVGDLQWRTGVGAASGG